MIIFIASISVIGAYFVASSVFGNISRDAAKVKVIDSIDSTIVQPRPDIFNANAINPAVQVQITGTSASTAGTQ